MKHVWNFLIECFCAWSKMKTYPKKQFQVPRSFLKKDLLKWFLINRHTLRYNESIKHFCISRFENIYFVAYLYCSILKKEKIWCSFISVYEMFAIEPINKFWRILKGRKTDRVLLPHARIRLLKSNDLFYTNATYFSNFFRWYTMVFSLPGLLTFLISSSVVFLQQHSFMPFI